MNASRNRIVNFNSGINMAKEHEKNLKNEALQYNERMDHNKKED